MAVEKILKEITPERRKKEIEKIKTAGCRMGQGGGVERVKLK